jgi:hypothetical protein
MSTLPADYLYKSRFETSARIVSPSDQDRFVAKASIDALRGLLPSGIRPEDNPDLLYFAADGAVAGMVNKNGDSVTTETALAINHTAKHKFISTEHDRDSVVGFILDSAVTRFGTSEPITASEAAMLKEPFNMSVVGALWKAVNPMLSKYLTMNDDSVGTEALSLSWEIAFQAYDIGVGSKNLFDAKVISSDDQNFGAYDRLLTCNGGNGRANNGDLLFRIIKGSPVILGYSIVSNPAADVKGILPITKNIVAENIPENPDNGVPAEVTTMDRSQPKEAIVSSPGEEAAASTNQLRMKEPVALPDGQYNALRFGYVIELSNSQSAKATILGTDEGVRNTREGATSEVVEIKSGKIFFPSHAPVVIDSLNTSLSAASENISQKSQQKNITPDNPRVNLNRPNPMDIKTISDIEQNWAEICKMEATASVALIQEAINKGSEEYVAKIEAEKNLLKNAEEAKASAEKRSAELEVAIAEVRKQLEELTQRAQASELAAKYQERMASFEEDFDLDDEDRQLIASDIRELSDEAFAAYAKKCKKLMAGKFKRGGDPTFKKTLDKDKTDDSCDKGGKASDHKDADDAKASVDLKAAFASAKDNGSTDTKIVNGVNVDEDLLATMKNAFAESFKLDGKPLSAAKK